MSNLEEVVVQRPRPSFDDGSGLRGGGRGDIIDVGGLSFLSRDSLLEGFDPTPDLSDRRRLRDRIAKRVREVSDTPAGKVAKYALGTTPAGRLYNTARFVKGVLKPNTDDDKAANAKGGRIKASKGRKIREGLEFIIDSIKNNKYLTEEGKEELIESETILDMIKKTDFIPDAESKTDYEKTKAETDFLQENEALDLDGLRKLNRFIFSVERKGGLLSNRGVPEKTIKKILEVDFPLYKTSEKDLSSSEKSLKNKADKFYNVDRLLRRDERTPMLVVHEKGREPRQEGGSIDDMAMPPEMMDMEDDMPVDTYPNIPPEEMAAAEASQLPDAEMEEEYLSVVLDQSLNDQEQDYLTKALEADPKLSQILDKVIVTASEFSGSGKVEGPGTGVSDSIPARLSDGEFVFTKKATDQMGADNLQEMMDDAERAYDGGMMRSPKKEGGMLMYKQKDENPLDYEKIAQDEIKKNMLRANRAPSLLGGN